MTTRAWQRFPTTRNVPVVPARTGLLVVDMQYYCAWRGEGELTDAGPEYDYFLDRVEKTVVPNTVRLIECCRANGIEVLYTVIESLTLDGRDRSLDHKHSDMHVPRGSRLGQVIAPIAPRGDEIVIPKTSSGIFNSTNVEYVLRNLGVEYLMITGVYSNQCVESAVRDAADRGFIVTMVEDCTATKKPEWHAACLVTCGGYARLRSTDQMVAEISSLAAAAE